METETMHPMATCETCQVEMFKKEIGVNELDANNLSLLAIFNIQSFYWVECPGCRRSGLHITS